MKKEERVILEFCDWNMEDKYYEVPLSILKEFKEKARKDFSATWTWFHEQVDYDGVGGKDKPVKYGKVNMLLDRYFLDYGNAQESLSEWEGI